MLQQLHNIKIGPRLAIAYVLVLALLAGMAVISAIQASKLAANTDYYASNIVPSIDAMRKVVIALEDVRRFQLQHVAADDIASSTEAEEGVVEARRRLEHGLKSYEALHSSAEETRMLAHVKASVSAYLANWDALRIASQQGAEDEKQDREAKRLFRESAKAFDAVHKAALDWGAYKETVSQEYKQNSAGVFRSAMIWLGVFTSLALLVGIVSALLMTRSITRPLGEALGVARKVAAGDLTATVRPRGDDEVSELLRALDNMNRRLAAVVADVRGASERVAGSSRDIASGNNELSVRTERQASNLEETAASMEELAATVQRNAESAQEASTLAKDAARAARRGGQSMEQVVATIQEMGGTSHKIAEIISVVDGIAFQTNILALNAAVEAARAGEHGRGFAVVASEVRALAQRSAEAAKDVKSLIDGTVTQVDQGMRLVAQTSEAVSEIVAQVQRVSDLLAEIAAASREQTRSIGHVSQAVVQLEQVTQQNAQLVGDSAAGAEQLRAQAQNLVTAVSVFRLGQGDMVAEASRPDPTPSVRAQVAAGRLVLRPVPQAGD